MVQRGRPAKWFSPKRDRGHSGFRCHHSHANVAQVYARSLHMMMVKGIKTTYRHYVTNNGGRAKDADIPPTFPVLSRWCITCVAMPYTGARFTKLTVVSHNVAWLYDCDSDKQR